jgi:CHAT domain-containing protein
MELNTLRMKIGQKTLAGPSHGESLLTHQQSLKELNIQREQIEEYLAHNIPEIKLEQKLKAANRQEISNALSKEDALVEFIRFNVFDFLAIPARGESMLRAAHYIAFVMLSGEPENNVQMIDLGEAEPIDMMIAAFRQSIISKESRRHMLTVSSESRQDISKTLTDKGFALRAALFDPLVGALKGRKTILFAPDGDLARLPFEVLPLNKDGHCLIDEYFISYLTTGRDILRFEEESVARRLPTDPLVAADPDFDFSSSSNSNSSSMSEILSSTEHEIAIPQNWHSRGLSHNTIHFGPIRGTRIEGEQIADMLHVHPWLGSRVLETPLKSCKSPRILHIATHGFFLPDQVHDPPIDRVKRLGIMNTAMMNDRLSGEGLENPLLRSGLALAGANTWLQHGKLPTEAEDGILTAEDVSGMDLSSTELVVLSACETGLGEVHTGEGVFGLRRAFVLAGAQTLVMSLWKVPDEKTTNLMIKFYNGILAGTPRAKALRQAQRKIKEKDHDPFSWGAFICQGNPGPISKQNEPI